jgi:hypothetical protein
MSLFNNRAAPLAAVALLATSACGGNGSVPSSPGVGNTALQLSVLQGGAASPADSTSILKKFKKDVVIGSTVDPTNGDMGPRALSRASITYGHLKKGQLVVCNFADASGTAGNGTTIDVLNPSPGAKPTTFVQSSKIQGCDGDALGSANDAYAAGLSSKIVAAFNQNGRYQKTYGLPIEAPLASADAFCGEPYAPEDVYVSDSKTGAMVKFSISIYGNPNEVEVIQGFAVNKGSGWSVLGPSGMQYNARRIGSRCNDTLYIVDGVDNTVVAISNASSLLVKGEIVVKPGGKTFTCKHPKVTCARLVYSGSPLNAPVASALFPNGNLIVANTVGGNKLVEITPAGKLLATKSVDKSSVAHVFALLAAGTSDSNTVLFYTDTKDNSVHELEQ